MFFVFFKSPQKEGYYLGLFCQNMHHKYLIYMAQVKSPVTVSSGCSSQSSAPPLTLTVSVPQPLHKICKHTQKT